MSDQDGSQTKGIPSWQRFEAPDSPSPAEQQSPIPNEQTAAADRASLIDKARRFLEDDDIRDASIERKQYFLQLKGLTEDEIRDLLNRQHMPEAEVAKGFYEEQDDVSRIDHLASVSNDSSEATPAIPPKDIVPIITYPEFLIHTQKQPPLVTTQRLLTALYIASGAAATIYGTSKYIVEPMVETLTAARQSLFDTAHTNLTALNKKLEESVSKGPEMSFAIEDIGKASVDSDPAHFFNRSAATQTSPHLSRSTSSDSSDIAYTSTCSSSTHEATLSTLKNRLSDLLPVDKEASSPVKDSIDELQKCLDGLIYGDVLSRNSKGNKANEDAVAKVKSEIRGVKGVLLSARNFPSGVFVR
ncbi:hypothetical protein N7G274_000928 [Stereocaulon virgatum]|uniref:Peroxisomal membrane protein PEX14 n=1 Tax=Stereocaulon virgatum TaxID=373712 RepID=A0ABR4AME4_9LECA